MPATTTGASRVGERSTIEDVASGAGVSVATVSRALRGLPNVAVSTRSRVEEVARELNYRADPAASRLAAGRSRTIAVVVPMINSWYFSNVVAGAEAVCAEVGYDLLILTAPDTAARQNVVTTAAALDRRVDGLIFVEVALPPDELVELGRHRLGVVTVGQQTMTFPSVHVDNMAVGETAVGHLVQLGHRRIGIVGAQAEE
ncbi:MAG: LacI family DNA-binding transcriptional regulator, partial [Acidimicrobiia bacterium]|nr:LacI family DNA-binding transcriptional regulator [Acidimicrobiia bacterium]